MSRFVNVSMVLLAAGALAFASAAGGSTGRAPGAGSHRAAGDPPGVGPLA
jgi:hypothetical protein